MLYGDLIERRPSSVGKYQAKAIFHLVDKVGIRLKKYRLVINKSIL